MHKLVITGGHHNSALVVAKEFLNSNVKVVWIGHRHSSRGDTTDSAEYLEVTASKIPFYDLTAARLLPSFREFLLFPLGILRALQILRRVRPSAILSFGGYLGGTVAIAGYILGIPIYLHEQTVTAGRSNRLIALLSRRIFLTWSQSLKYFPKSKSIVVGLPLRPSLLTPTKSILFTRHKPTLLVMGGKQGAHAINQFIFTHLSTLLMGYNVVHQTGNNSQTQDYERALAMKNSLGSLSDSYLPFGYIVEAEIGKYLHNAAFYFGRSGAHITYELSLLSIPSLLVPLMSTHDGEQHKNALMLVNSSQGVIIPESSLSLPLFMQQLNNLKKLKSSPLSLPRDAAAKIIASISADQS